MPTFNIMLAQDVICYGSVSVEGDTWEKAAASLTEKSWDECCQESDGGWEQRVVYVEDDDTGNILAEDISYNTEMVHYRSVIYRLTTIMANPDRVPCLVTQQALEYYMEELRAMVRDPIFNEKE
jgi:hypothetical protein